MKQRQHQIMPKKIIFKDFAPFTNCISRINNMQVDDAHDIDVDMPMYSFIEYSNNYSQISEILWKYVDRNQTLAAYGTTITVFNAD